MGSRRSRIWNRELEGEVMGEVNEKFEKLPGIFLVNFDFNPDGKTHIVRKSGFLGSYAHNWRTGCGLEPNANSCLKNRVYSLDDLCQNCKRSSLYDKLTVKAVKEEE